MKLFLVSLILLAVSLTLFAQDKTVPLKGVVILTARGVPSAPVLLAVR